MLAVDNFSFFSYGWSFFGYNSSFFTYSWSFFAYSGKVRLIRALGDCKQRSLTVSKKARTVSKKAPTASKKASPELLLVWKGPLVSVASAGVNAAAAAASAQPSHLD